MPWRASAVAAWSCFSHPVHERLALSGPEGHWARCFTLNPTGSRHLAWTLRNSQLPVLAALPNASLLARERGQCHHSVSLGQQVGCLSVRVWAYGRLTGVSKDSLSGQYQVCRRIWPKVPCPPSFLGSYTEQVFCHLLASASFLCPVPRNLVLPCPVGLMGKEHWHGLPGFVCPACILQLMVAAAVFPSGEPPLLPVVSVGLTPPLAPGVDM